MEFVFVQSVGCEGEVGACFGEFWDDVWWAVVGVEEESSFWEVWVWLG